MEKREVYLDNSATTRVDDRVIEEMTYYMRHLYGNPHSIHDFGYKAYEAKDNARKIVAKSLNARNHEIIFTSGGTESDNMAIIGCYEKFRMDNPGKNANIITTAIEHPAVLNAARHLKSTYGIEVKELEVNEFGEVDPNKVLEALNKDTLLVSVMAANNEIGTVQPITEIGKIIRDKNQDQSSGIKTLFHTDAVQAFTKLDIDVNRDNIDLLSISAHKFHGPKGVGALFMRNQGKTENRDGKYIVPINYGGNQESGWRSGTSNIPGIVGLAKAVEIVNEHPEERENLKKLRDKLIEMLLAEIPKLRLTGHPQKRLVSHVSFLVPDIPGDKMLNLLSSNKIFVSTGSACSAHSKTVSYVLKAIRIPEPDVFGSMRWTLSKYNTIEDIEYAVSIFKKIVEKLRLMEDHGIKN